MINKTRKLKIAIYSPYLHIQGGGERYLLSLAEALSREYKVFLLSDKSIRKKASSFFNISLDRVYFLPNKILRTRNLLKKYISLLSFNMFFYMTDGSLFFSLPTSKNFLIVQSPVHIPNNSLLNKIKLKQWKILCYSKFMQKIILDKLGKQPFILAPYIKTPFLKKTFSEKENIILSVGRFFPFPHNKRQDFLLSLFKKYHKTYFSGWRLIIAGGLTEKGGEVLIDELKKESRNLPVDILVNVSHWKLKKLYSQSKIYWHAAGFEEDLKKHPERAEHFGISILEAMAARVVPIVFNAGGPQEIVTEGKNGYIWNSKEELVKKTTRLINNNNLLKLLAQKAEKRVADFTREKFYEKLKEIIHQ